MNWIDEFRELNPDTVKESTVTKKEHKLDLFKVVLPALDRRDKNFYNNASEDDRKELSKQIWPLTRWMSSTKNNTEHHLLMANDVVNKNSSELKRHPELQWKLLALCGFNKAQMHQWISPPRGIKKNKIEDALLNVMPMLKDDELALLLTINSKDELSALFKEAGLSDKEIKDLFA